MTKKIEILKNNYNNIIKDLYELEKDYYEYADNKTEIRLKIYNAANEYYTELYNEYKDLPSFNENVKFLSEYDNHIVLSVLAMEIYEGRIPVDYVRDEIKNLTIEKPEQENNLSYRKRCDMEEDVRATARLIKRYYHQI